MSDSAFAQIVTIAIFAGLAAWPIFLDGLALWMRQHPLQRLMAEIESIRGEGLEANGLEADSGA